MLFDAIVSALGNFLHSVFSSLPTSSLAGVMGDVSGFAHDAGAKLAPWNHWLPLRELAAIGVLLITIWVPAMILYVVANWIWRHIPDVLGTGPGAG